MGLFGIHLLFPALDVKLEILFHNKITSVKTRGVMGADIQFSVCSVRVRMEKPPEA